MEKLYITDFGAVEGTVVTDKIQEALDFATKMGGLTVAIPRGTFITGTLNLGCASLYLEKGSILKGSGDPAHYYANGYMHNELKECISLIYSMSNDNITISGDGVIDMNAMAFFDLNKRDVPNYGIPFTEKQVEECTASVSFRPTQPIFFYNCNSIKIEGIRITNAPCWTISFNECDNVRVEAITIDNSHVIPNNDGIHLCSCKNVFVHSCNISSGDDCIALTAITNWEKPCENVVISDCVLRSCSKAIVMGYMHSIIRNVVVSNCVIVDSQRAIAFMSSTKTGLVEHILIENMRLDTRIRAGNWWGNGEPICIFALYHNGDYCLLPVPDRDWEVNISDIQFNNISCSGENVIGIIGKNYNVQNIYMNGIYMERKESKNRYLKGDYTIDVSPCEEKVKVPDDGNIYWAHIQGCKNIKIDNAYLAPYKNKKMLTSIVDCENVIVNER